MSRVDIWRKFYSKNYMKNTFLFTIYLFIVKLEYNDIKIFWLL